MHFLSQDWQELQWTSWIPFIDPTAFKQLPIGPGVYRIRAIDQDELFYIGETGNLRQRLSAHARKTWGSTPSLFSLVQLPDTTPDYQRHEIENDLIGAFYAQTQNVATFQLINHK